MSELLIVRHGQSESNAGMAATTPSTTPLTEHGHKQARAYAASITEQPDLIVVSPYVRTQQTAAPLRERYPDVPCEEWPVQEFTYLEPARYSGTTKYDRRPVVAEYWEKNDPAFHDGPGAESFIEVMDRVNTTIEKARMTQGRTIMFCHGKFMRLLFWQLMNGPHEPTSDSMKEFRGLRIGLPIANTAVLTIRFHPEVMFSPFSKAHLHPEDVTF